MSRRRRGSGRRPWWRRRPLAAVGVGAGVVAILALGAYGFAPDASGADASPAVSEEVLETGASLYQTSCATCHGESGEGFAQPGMPAPPLDGSAHSWHHPDPQIIGLIRDGGSQMPAVGPDWSDGEVEAVLAYVKNWWAPWQRDSQPGEIGE